MRATTTPSAVDTADNDPSTTAKLAAAAHSAVDIAAANLEQAEQALREARVAAGQKVHDGARQAQSLSEDAVSSVKAYIDLYPLRSVGIALAAGFLISSLIRK
jgi:ElaB/YqjD/DUF883 family membrane-anchored ribosome-binding protein